MASNYPTSLDSYITLVDNTDDVLAAHVNDRGDAIEGLEAKVGIDSSAVVTSFDYFLKHSSGAYRTHQHDGTSDDGALFPINNLSDVEITSVADNQFLRYDTASGKWKNEAFSVALTDLSDVNTTGVAQYSGLVYNGSSWEDGFPNAYYAA